MEADTKAEEYGAFRRRIYIGRKEARRDAFNHIECCTIKNVDNLILTALSR